MTGDHSAWGVMDQRTVGVIIRCLFCARTKYFLTEIEGFVSVKFEKIIQLSDV